MKKTNYLTLSKILYWVVSASFVFTLIYVPIRALTDQYYRENSEYVIMLFQTAMGLVIINLPSFLNKRFTWQIPPLFATCFILFLFSAIFLGETMKFYYRIPFWDDLLHLCSSMMLALLGFSMIEMLNRDKKHSLVNLSPFFVCLFSVTFAMLIGTLWEIYEFTFDGLLGLNMQKFAVESGIDGEKLVDLVGRQALKDTMLDLIIDLSGATIISLICYPSLKKGKGGWIEAFKVEIKDDASLHRACEEALADGFAQQDNTPENPAE